MIIPLRPRPLIVTQQLIIAADIYLQLSKLNCNVVGINSSSNDALEAITDQQPDVVLIDLSLKGSIDSIKLGKIVAEQYKIPVIFLNPGMDEHTINLAISQNPEAFIHIPYEINDLKKKITRATTTYQAPLKLSIAVG